MASEKERLQAKQMHQEKKRKVVEHYSKGTMKCRRCGFSDIRALSIDHINGGGVKHIRVIGNFYSWLINNNFPPGFQVLCMNCQWIKRAENNENPGKRKRPYERKLSKERRSFTDDYWKTQKNKIETAKALENLGIYP